MKKSFKKLICLMMVLVMCLSIQIPTSAASAKYTAVQKVYERYMSKKVGTYSIRDLDGNGIPELIMTLRNTNASYVYTYNYSTKKMVRLAALNLGDNPDERAMFSRAKHMVRFCSYNESKGYSVECFYSISGYKATLKYKLVVQTKGNGASPTNARYYVNGKRCAKWTYTNYLRILWKTLKDVEIDVNM